MIVDVIIFSLLLVLAVAAFCAGIVAGRERPLPRASLYDRLGWAELRHVPKAWVAEARRRTITTFSTGYDDEDWYPRMTYASMRDWILRHGTTLRTTNTVIVKP